MNILWATRGHTWAFSFLRNDFDVEPLLAYDAGFEGFPEDSEGCFGRSNLLALRFFDPEGRSDFSGRSIVHEFVVAGDDIADINTLDEGRRRIWPVVADEYAKIWNSPEPPKGDLFSVHQ